MKNKVDMEKYTRRAVFDHMKSISQPFYSVTFRQDVTRLRQFAREAGISFYYAMTCLVSLAVNKVPEMRMYLGTSEDGAESLCIYDERLPSFTDLAKGSDAFYIVTMSPQEGIKFGEETLHKVSEGDLAEFVRSFCAKAEERSRYHHENGIFLRTDLEDTGLIFISCLPWLDITGLTNEREFDRLDSVPRIAWGRYTEENGRLMIGVSVEVNHIFVDGVHIGRFAEALTEYIEALPLDQ